MRYSWAVNPCEQMSAPVPGTILIIDDNVDLLEALSLRLRRSGLNVITASDGKVGLEQARLLLPDLIILDLVLPEVDGLTICATLRRSGATASIPIVLLTGVTSQLSHFAGMDCGADEYITKPFDFELLLARIRQLLRQTQVATKVQ